jgi:hypothetical protein
MTDGNLPSILVIGGLLSLSWIFSLLGRDHLERVPVRAQRKRR